MERSMRPKKRTKKVEDEAAVNSGSTKSPDGLNMAERKKLAEMAAKKMGDGRKNKHDKTLSRGTMKKPVAMKSGGKMPMVKKDGKSVPSFAADGVGKMMYGGKMPEKMNMGGKCRGMGAATRGGNFKMG